MYLIENFIGLYKNLSQKYSIIQQVLSRFTVCQAPFSLWAYINKLNENPSSCGLGILMQQYSIELFFNFILI